MNPKQFFNKVIKKKEVNIKMNIEIPDELTTSEFEKLMGWLVDNGFKPIVKGKGNGAIYIKTVDPSIKEEPKEDVHQPHSEDLATAEKALAELEEEKAQLKGEEKK